MNIREVLAWTNQWFRQIAGSPIVQAAIVIALGLVAIVIINRRLRLSGLPPQMRLLLRRAITGTVIVVTLLTVLGQFEIDYKVLLGTAGILTVAVGFASQTSASNLISGLFLMAERPFVVGDIIQVGDTSGYVEAIDLISCRIRTFANLLVRIPNETMLRSNVTNLTAHPIRRVDMQVGVAYKEDVARVREVLMETADRNPICLEEPAPLFIFVGFGDSSLDFQFSVWAARENFLLLKNTIHEEVKRAFDRTGIEIPFPHRTLYTGSVTEPFPVRILEAAPDAREGSDPVPRSSPSGGSR